MGFEDILGDCRLWALVEEGEPMNVLYKTFETWNNQDELRQFFLDNLSDLTKYFNIRSVDNAIFDTIEESHCLECLILDTSPSASLDAVFRPLEPYRMTELFLSKEKAKGERLHSHPSWLRIYAIKLAKESYLVTGGAIKLTHTMAERAHTLEQLRKMETVRNYLIENGVFDSDGLKDLVS